MEPRPQILIFRDPPRSGQENMAIDERLLGAVKPGGPVLVRLYRWSEPTLSLGHFQSTEEAASAQAGNRIADRVATLPRVRRKTGGGAILHDMELTYSLVVPLEIGPNRKGPSEPLYRAVHESIRDGLRAMGLTAALSEECTCYRENADNGEPFLCFERRTPVDLVLGEHKILGSAQRRGRCGLLQHGSLLIRSSAACPWLLGIEEIAGRVLGIGAGWEEGCDASFASFPALDWGVWTDWLQERILVGMSRALGWDCEELMLNVSVNPVELVDWIEIFDRTGRISK